MIEKTPLILFYEAFVVAQKSFKAAEQTGFNPHFRSKYATHTDIWEAVREALHKNGLMVSQSFYPQQDRMIMTTNLIHKGGHSISSSILLPVEENAQKLGSLITYHRRYQLSCLLGVAIKGEDDDGNEANKTIDTLTSSLPHPSSSPIFRFKMGTADIRGKTFDEIPHSRLLEHIAFIANSKNPDFAKANKEVLMAYEEWKKVRHSKPSPPTHKDFEEPPYNDSDIPF